MTKNEKRRASKKRKKQQSSSEPSLQKTTKIGEGMEDNEEIVIPDEMKEVFIKFQEHAENAVQPSVYIPPSQQEEEEEHEEKRETKRKTLGKQKRKKLSRFSVAELKQVVNRPDVVEKHDVASPDPLLHVSLKSIKNSVSVPRHWSSASKFLQHKRNQEQVSYKLPSFIAETGINTIRAALAEEEAKRKSSQKARERVQPRMGKLDLDYQVLHDAFFKHQSKPKLRRHGDVFAENETNNFDTGKFKPGKLTKALREALDMKEGSPPPWLFNMQRFGPPPSYPWLKIPGVNAPLPPGAKYGFEEFGWGSAPVDQFGRPLYGDVFASSSSTNYASAPTLSTHWGDLVEEEEEEEEQNEEESSEEEGDDEQVAVDRNGSAESSDSESSEGSLQEKQEEEKRQTEESKLYQVLEQEETKVGDSTFGGTHKYKIAEKKPRGQKQEPQQQQDDKEDEALESSFKF